MNDDNDETDNRTSFIYLLLIIIILLLIYISGGLVAIVGVIGTSVFGRILFFKVQHFRWFNYKKYTFRGTVEYDAMFQRTVWTSIFLGFGITAVLIRIWSQLS